MQDPGCRQPPSERRVLPGARQEVDECGGARRAQAQQPDRLTAEEDPPAVEEAGVPVERVPGGAPAPGGGAGQSKATMPRMFRPSRMSS